ncbi:hypothetical protein [Niastella vici]|uniref:hypothetical protein n=1 Tax=Niastella vici TaxID=1703345 RepID=UPI00117E2813|nr:hypothetical protein [Niastella vici]
MVEDLGSAGEELYPLRELQSRKDVVNPNNPDEPAKKDISKDEIFASFIENKIRLKNNLPLRTHYSPIAGGGVVRESSFTTNTYMEFLRTNLINFKLRYTQLSIQQVHQQTRIPMPERTRSRAKDITIARISIVIYISFCLSCVTGKYESRNRTFNILDQYVKSQHYRSDDDGRSLRIAEQKIANRFEKDFDSVKSIIVIKEYCSPYQLSGYVYSNDIQNGRFFYQTKRFAELNFEDPAYSVAPIFYKRIIELLQKDSLEYYKKINDADFPADDEFCWLYVIKGAVDKNRYSEKKIVFNNPLALRRRIISY